MYDEASHSMHDEFNLETSACKAGNQSGVKLPQEEVMSPNSPDSQIRVMKAVIKQNKDSNGLLKNETQESNNMAKAESPSQKMTKVLKSVQRSAADAKLKQSRDSSQRKLLMPSQVNITP